MRRFRRFPMRVAGRSRLKTGVKRNTQYYRIQKFIRKLINNPLKYYLYQKIKNYPHVYSSNRQVLLPKKIKNE